MIENFFLEKVVLVFGEFFQFYFVCNFGVVFFFGFEVIWIFMIVLVIVVGVIVWKVFGFWFWFWVVVFGCFFGGVLGNFIDCLFWELGFFVGYVVDMILMFWMMLVIFNVVDIFIVMGMILVVLLVVFGFCFDGMWECDYFVVEIDEEVEVVVVVVVEVIEMDDEVVSVEDLVDVVVFDGVVLFGVVFVFEGC